MIDPPAPAAPAAHTKNRLAAENSPYLLLHQDNPVDWYPWGEEALAKAKAEGKPIFLSVGYSTCYWCHVMERESFEDPDIAALLNRHFVSIKVDREERPDLDEIYMTATQLLTGQGGWPNSVFLTPELKPFYAGTYFPPRDSHGRPGFGTLLLALQDAWKNRRGDIALQADEVAAAMKRFLAERVTGGGEIPGAEVAERSLAALAQRFDPEWGGFGGAPKFPTPSNLFLLAELAAEDPEAAGMLNTTLDQMARGGFYDQLAGGFHRYATDREWRVPHFEKMLYDNGLLLEVYALELLRTGNPERRRICRETADFLLRELSLPEGGFASAIDAETDGHEGAYYVWTRAELDAALGPEDAAYLAPLLGYAGRPFFEGTHYVLHIPRPVDELAGERRISAAALLAEMAPLRTRLLGKRSQRERPATDDKVLTDWNGTAIAGLALAGKALSDPALVARAAEAARFALKALVGEDGTLRHSFRVGTAKQPAFLADYAFLVHGLLMLDRVGAAGEWLPAARELSAEAVRRLGDPEGGFFTAAAAPDLLFRNKEVFDGALPAANAVMVLDLLRLAERTGEERHLAEAARTLLAVASLIEHYPDAVRTFALATRRYRARVPAPAAAARERPAGPLDLEADRLVRTELVAPAAGSLRHTLRITITDGWHINANPAKEEFLIATSVVGDGVALSDVVYPATADAVYRGVVEIECGFGEGKPAGAAIIVTYQACDASRCLPPRTRRIPLP